MKKGIFILISLILSVSLYSQHVGIKNNLLYDATLTPNLGLEIGMGKKTTLDLIGAYNPFTFKDDRRFKHWLAQPEVRFWSCEKFNGTFWGIHAHGGEFSVGGWKLPFDMFKPLKDHRYEGYFVGGGISVGHQWMLSKHWNLEASIGAGYAFIEYEKYKHNECGPRLKKDTYNYWGVTKATISLIYIIK